MTSLMQSDTRKKQHYAAVDNNQGVISCLQYIKNQVLVLEKKALNVALCALYLNY